MTTNTDAWPMTDAQIRASMTPERKLTCQAIEGAMAFGYQNTNQPPDDDHWLAPYWKIGRKQAELEAGSIPSIEARRTADALRSCDWSNTPIGTKAIVERAAQLLAAPAADSQAERATGVQDERESLRKEFAFHDEVLRLAEIHGDSEPGFVTFDVDDLLVFANEVARAASTSANVAQGAEAVPVSAIEAVADFLEDQANIGIISQFTAVQEWIDAHAIKPHLTFSAWAATRADWADKYDADVMQIGWNAALVYAAPPAQTADMARGSEPIGRDSIEAAQRERLNARFADRKSTPSTADFDLPAQSDAVVCYQCKGCGDNDAAPGHCVRCGGTGIEPQPVAQANFIGPIAEVGEDAVFFLKKMPDGSRWPRGTKLYAALTAAQSASGDTK
jgi:hypothetical protein